MRPRTKAGEIGELGRAVRRLRDETWQTQREFAQAIGYSITTIARYETGREPKGWALVRLTNFAMKVGARDLAKTFAAAIPTTSP